MDIIKYKHKILIFKDDKIDLVNLILNFVYGISIYLVIQKLDNPNNLELDDNSYLLDFSNDISVSSNISIVGSKNGTTIDYDGNERKGCFQFQFGQGKFVKFENIIFKNYNPVGQNNVNLLRFSSKNDNFQIIFENCTFLDNGYPLISYELNSNCIKKPLYEHQLILNNCKFYCQKDSVIYNFLF
ncbi:hypothetical protein PIROE2DRAFT_8881 [Piromyces sp. E2]|nr:hypothetical protein PIROE2DRAFT_8881 [Piromyces sp. E2]|eukprot:OUM64330.1 hypothetical protein PIROE2DRAFT_8881 [Piromyces sp. E2]